MRELKFRAWSPSLQKWRADWSISCYEKVLHLNYRGNLIDDDLIIEQFTGLHDKNGKEIYEGDIVNAYYDRSEIGVGGSYRVYIGVGYDSDGYQHSQWYGWKAGHSSLIDIEEVCEVIGNIHENKELLCE